MSSIPRPWFVVTAAGICMPLPSPTRGVSHIDKTRAACVLDRILDSGYRGAIGRDYFSADHKYIRDNDGQARFRFAHLIREPRFPAEHSSPETRNYAIRSLAAARRLFRIDCRLRDNPAGDRQALVKAGERLRRTDCPLPTGGRGG